MDAHRRRIEDARARNLAYIEEQDAKKAERAADEFLKQHLGPSADSNGPNKSKQKAAGQSNNRNTSVYVTGLTTYIACKQLEGLCGKIGKVRRIKFYQDDRGGLKGDALVTFASHATMAKAVEKLNHLEIKPGVLITATEAQFGAGTASNSSKTTEPSRHNDEASEAIATGPERLFSADILLKETSIERDGKGDGATHKSSQQPVDDVLATTTTAEELSLPSRSVILRKVWDPLAPQDDATQFFTELEDDMRSECSRHGTVDHVHILPTGAVMIRYAELASAIQCLQAMNGRWFDGRQLEAVFDPSTPEEPADDDTKLDAFFASLG